MKDVIIQGENLFEHIEDIILNRGYVPDKGLLLYGKGVSRTLSEKYFPKWRLYIVHDSTDHEVMHIENSVGKENFIVAIGGGKVVDTGKVVAYRRSIPFVSVPTTLSNDGIFSPISVIKINGIPESLLTKPPSLLIIDYTVIKDSPKWLILAGIGDLMANISACLDWKLAISKGKDYVNQKAYSLSWNGAIKLLNSEEKPFSIPFLKLLAEGLINSGKAMTVFGSSRPASGAEHLISHALDRILPSPLPHGIQVGLATLLTLLLHREDEFFKSLRNFYKNIGFPVSLKDVGVDRESFLKAVRLAPTLRPSRFTILHTHPPVEDALDLII